MENTLSFSANNKITNTVTIYAVCQLNLRTMWHDELHNLQPASLLTLDLFCSSDHIPGSLAADEIG